MSIKIKRSNPDALKKVYERLGNATKMEVAVGFPSGKCQAYPDGTEVAAVASFHVYGMGVPRRDFMALALPDIKAHTKEIMKAASGGGLGEEQVAALQNAAGQLAADDIKKAITDLDSPPNAPATIAAKGSDNPLIDTGHMRQVVTYVVREK